MSFKHKNLEECKKSRLIKFNGLTFKKSKRSTSWKRRKKNRKIRKTLEDKGIF